MRDWRLEPVSEGFGLNLLDADADCHEHVGQMNDESWKLVREVRPKAEVDHNSGRVRGSSEE